MPPELRPQDRALLLDMRLAAEDAMSFVAGMDEGAFTASRLHQNAVVRSLQVVGEAASKVSTAARAELGAIPWRTVIGMRHRLVHGYADVRLDVVWATVRDDLPVLIAALRGVV